MASNIRRIWDWKAASLAYVFGQLEDMGAARAEWRDIRKDSLAQWERDRIRRELRRNLKASLDLLKGPQS